MKELGISFKELVATLAVIVLVMIGITWIAQGSDFFLYKVFAPKIEAVRRETFVQSQAYNEGVAQEVRQAQLDYARASTPDQKAAICSYVAHFAGGYETSRLPSNLQSFVNQCAGGAL